MSRKNNDHSRLILIMGIGLIIGLSLGFCSRDTSPPERQIGIVTRLYTVSDSGVVPIPHSDTRYFVVLDNGLEARASSTQYKYLCVGDEIIIIKQGYTWWVL